jgi:dTDP-4-dehydrorhamnose 3,5-epimerase
MVDAPLSFRELAIPGAWLIEPLMRSDDRGSFSRVFSARSFAERGLETAFAERSVSHNIHRLTLRGLHFQHPPHAEAKLVRCTQGAIFDVLVDLRPGMASFGTWIGMELTPAVPRALYIPPGCAHGFLTLVDATDVDYAISPEYAPGASGGVRWDDPEIGIAWPARPLHISDRDRALPGLGVVRG